MQHSRWKKKIKAACQEAGTYRPYFDGAIDTLAEILEKRDETREAYEAMPEGPVIQYTNKVGASNPVRNPALVLLDELNKSALAYWRDLGLTPAGLKKIDEKSMSKQKAKSLDKMIKELSG